MRCTSPLCISGEKALSPFRTDLQPTFIAVQLFVQQNGIAVVGVQLQRAALRQLGAFRIVKVDRASAEAAQQCLAELTVPQGLNIRRVCFGGNINGNGIRVDQVKPFRRLAKGKAAFGLQNVFLVQRRIPFAQRSV